MTVATADIAESMRLSESELIRQALKSFIQEKRRETLLARLEILARYQVDTIAELETQIAEGQVAEHPGWEDLITVENLDARLEELDAYLRDL